MTSTTRGTAGASAGVRIRACVALCVIAIAVAALAGCGSSKPAYCSDRTNLTNSVKELTSLNLTSGISGLQTQLKKIQTNANKLVSSAKGHFPTETTAIRNSIDQ